MSGVSTLLAQQVFNWQLEDFAYFRKCGEITVSPDAQTYGMNCRFCSGICLQFDVFIEHMREVHAERVCALYQQTETPLEGAKCEQSTQTQIEIETFYSDALAHLDADDDFDIDIDVECIDGDERAYNYHCEDFNAAAIDNSNDNDVGSDTDTDSVAKNAQIPPTVAATVTQRRYPQRQRRSTVYTGTSEDKPRKVCSWNEAPSAKCNGTLGKFKTLTTTTAAIQTPPTPASTPSPWTTPIQNANDSTTTIAATTMRAVETEREATTIAMDTTAAVSLGAQIDMHDICSPLAIECDVDMQAQNGPEATQEVDLVYIMESTTPDGIIAEETVVDPFEMAQGWRRSTDSSECPENDLSSPCSTVELQKNLITLPLSALKAQSCEKPLVNENEHSTEVIFYLLEAYKKNEKLWNPNHPQYKYNANRKMFEELSRPLLRDMNYSLDGAEIYAIIKSLRSRYRLELAKARERKGKYKTRFKYYDKMEFLRDVIENKRAARKVKKHLDSGVSEKSFEEDFAETTRSTHNRTVLTYLIDAFRRQEALWNPQHANYLLGDKNELLREISGELLLEKGVNMSADECFTEIQKLRTRYRRELRIVHEQKGLYAPKLWCFEQMEFLQKIFEDQLRERLKKRKGVIACKPKTQYLKAKSIEFKSNDDHLTFIEIYKSYSALWDVDHPDYRSTTYRNEELNQMLEEVNLMLGINSTLEELQKTLYELRKEFSAEKHKRLVETADACAKSTAPQAPSIIQMKLMEFLDLNLGPFRCDVCNEVIKTSDQYKIHKSGHDGMQPFICTLCGKGFQIPGNLTIHIRRHKGDFPYACEVCDKKFATSTEVAIHMRSHTAPKYQTAYACEGKKLTIECDPGDLINLIRANYGRFSITICNDHGNVDWSVNCMFPKSLTVLNSKCAHKQSCSVLATTSMFGDPCPGTHKYLEAHYQCISAAQTSTTTNRPSPPWVLANNPPLLANGSTLINPGAPLQPQGPGRLPLPSNGGLPGSNGLWQTIPPPTPGPPQPTLPSGRIKGSSYNTTVIKNANRHDGLPPPPPLHHHHHTGHHAATPVDGDSTAGNTRPTAKNDVATRTPNTNQTKTHAAPSNTTTAPNTRILSGVGGSGTDDGTLLTAKTPQNRGSQQQQSTTTQQHATGNGNGNVMGNHNNGDAGNNGIRTINNINNLNMGLGAIAEDESNMYCGPTNARNLFWNITRVGDVNVQPCPGGATGIAKWRCVLMKRINYKVGEDSVAAETTTMRTVVRANCSSIKGNSSCETAADRLNQRIGNFEPTWHPITPDLTQCRSLWLNSLEVRVNQRESSVISIANDLSEVTSSKTLYGGDMLVTTKIIQTMSEKMFHDKETLPDQRQREAIILELLHGVVKTGSNLLDESQLSSWMDLNQEDQMRVATSLLTGLEYNAFLLADTIIRERNIVQKVKNILLSVRVLETKNIQSNEVFPDAEQWQISDDRIELPRTALIENSEGGLVRIVFAAFDRLESILKPTYDHFDTKSSRSYVRNTALLASERNYSAATTDLQQQRIRILNSKVISASLGKGRHIQLSQPIKLVLRHIKTENVTNPTCVFWNYIDHAWSANGCTLESTNRTHSICMCNHLTNFAILMDVIDEHNHSLFGVFDGNMRIFIYISVAICLVFVVIAILTLKIFNGVFIKSARTSIYRSIYICLFSIEILFLIGIEQNEASILCGFTTVFLHCSILAAIAWFCFEAFQSYSTLTTDDMLLEVDQTSKVNCYYLLAYGVTLTIVAISLAINPNTYTQNDFCVLMEANSLFYASFVAPVMLYLLGALGYTFLSWVIMCRKSHTTLKNKEHTRLANVRFDIRCSFIFLLLLSAVWISAYYYLRLSKMEDELAIVCGYLFISFNTLMGLYIFAFHCIQNEKIRREYRKYVRQNSWLPKCLRCSKASISSGVVGNNGIGGSGLGTGNGGGAGGGTLSGTHRGTISGVQLKKTKLPIGSDGLVSDETGGIISAGEDAIIASSDCELNDPRNLSSTGEGDLDIVKGAGASGVNMSLQQHSKGGHSIIDAMQGHIVLERGGGGANAMHAVSGSGGLRTPSAGHTSPTSSAGSTHLIFGGQKQQMIGAGVASAGGGPQEAYYHQPDYYGWKQQMGSSKSSGVNNALSLAHARDYMGNAAAPQQAHEFFYWTQKHQPHGKKKRGSGIGGESPSGSLHSRTTAASQQILFYPSYKKTTLKQQQLQQQQQQYPHYDEAVGAAAYYQQQQQQQQLQQHRRHASAAMMQQQLSSDEEQLDQAAAAHAHLLHLGRRAGSQLPPPPAPAPHAYHYPHSHHSPEFMGAAHTPTQRYYRNKRSNCDLSHEEYDPSGRAGSEQYYNQNSMGGDGPVYEEILSNRNSDVQHYEMDLNMYGVADDDDDDDDDERRGCNDEELENERSSAMRRALRQQQLRQRHHYEAARNGVIGGSGGGVGGNSGGGSRYGHAESGASSEEDDDDDDEEEAECESAQRRGLPQGDERMRRLIAMQDEEFQRRFQRQRKKGEGTLNDKTATAYFDHHNAPAPSGSSSSGGGGGGVGATVFGISGGGSGGAGSIRAIKKISPNNRIGGVHELFTTTHSSNSSGGGSGVGGSGFGPPLPPANQHQQQQQQQQQYPLTKRQQLSPTTLTATATATTPSSSHPQPIIGRNISAMLDENNTVRCYLEPLPK